MCYFKYILGVFKCFTFIYTKIEKSQFSIVFEGKKLISVKHFLVGDLN